jgi:ribosome-binding protein aMBF1 (putative translation factor)
MAGMEPKSPPNVGGFPLDDESHLADEELYDRAKRRLAAGEDELIPAAFANRIIDGENPVRVWREFRELSVKDLAAKAGISAAYLSQIEGGNREGSVATMKALATALGLDLDDLV